MLSNVLKIWSPDNGDGYALITDLARIVDDVEEAILNPPYIRLTGTADASATSVDHAFQIGPTSGQNLIADQNEMMARDGGNLATFNINYDGGDVGLGNAQSQVNIRGRLNAANNPWAESVGSMSSAAFSGSPQTVSSVSVIFPAGRFTQSPAIRLAVSTISPQLRMASFSDVSTSGFTINQYSEVSGWSTVHWGATQMSASSASG